MKTEKVGRGKRVWLRLLGFYGLCRCKLRVKMMERWKDSNCLQSSSSLSLLSFQVQAYHLSTYHLPMPPTDRAEREDCVLSYRSRRLKLMGTVNGGHAMKADASRREDLLNEAFHTLLYFTTYLCRLSWLACDGRWWVGDGMIGRWQWILSWVAMVTDTKGSRKRTVNK